MRRLGVLAAIALAFGSVFTLSRSAEPQAADRFHFPPAGDVTIYAPQHAPEQVVLFLSGDGGWNLGVVPMAERLRGLGALVVGIDIRKLQRHLEAGEGCAYPAGVLEELARTVELRARLPEYRRPILVGYSSGATLVYAALAQAPAETFAGGVSLGFCPDIELRTGLCRGRALVATPRRKGIGYDLAVAPGLDVPWMALQGDIDKVCSPAGTRRFVEAIPAARLFWLPKVGHGFGVTRRWDGAFVQAYMSVVQAHRARAAREAPAPAAPAVSDLPLIEVPAAPGRTGDLMAVVLSGDGGWAAIDKGVAGELAQRGVPVVGWNSLSYFWKPRTPEGAARDLARVLDHYGGAWGKSRVLLAGYSFGADVLPFMVTRLPASTRTSVVGVGLIGLSRTASFEFHVSGWLSDAGDARYPTPEEIDRLTVPALCLVGADEHDSACRATRAQVVALPGGHHFGGDYAGLARVLLQLVGGASRPQAGGS